MHILVILTGGTIGSKGDSDTINVDSAAAYQLIEMYQKKTNSSIDFDVIQPLNTLSENINPNHWSTLSHVFSEINRNEYQGIILTHGTDTLPYTSCLLGLLHGNSPIPIVITASNHCLSDARSNGLENFSNAVDLIKTSRLHGVFTIFQNDKNENIIYLPTRLMESDTYCDQYVSYGNVDFGKMSDGELMLIEHSQNPSPEDLHSQKSSIVHQPITFTNHVAFIRPYPGLNYNHFCFDEKTKAVVHYLYHSGTACTECDEYSLLKFIETCKNKNIDFYVSSFKNINQAMYDSSRKILDAGAIPLINMSPEASYVKAQIAYNQTEINPIEYMEKNVYFEMLPEL